MEGYGEAIAHGAATIINAIATGRGAAFGVNLWTKARVRITKDAGNVEGKILSDLREDTSLIKESVLTVFRYFHVHSKFGAYVETESNIPIAKGLKSSSTAANALVSATVLALGKEVKDTTLLNLSVDAAINAKTTITGAFDDTCASYYGNVVVTDNIKRKILKSFKIEEDPDVLFQIPPQKSYTYTSNASRMKLLAPQIEVAFKEAFSGNYWKALTLNGILYSATLRYSSEPAITALEAGALASGLSGKGPATVAVVHGSKTSKVIDAWRSFNGEIVKTKINRIMMKDISGKE